jgi:uncharacterized protein YndB with AHSA1/START domain
VIDFTIETDIARSPGDVFAYVTDPSKLPSWQTNTVSSELETDPPLRAGSRLREVHTAPGNRRVESLVEVSELDPDRAFGLRMLEGPLPLDATITFEPAGGGTRMRFRVHGQPSGAARIAQPLLRLALKQQFAAQCRTLKRLLEREPGAAGA